MSARVLSRIGEVSREAWDAVLGEDPIPFLRWDWIDAFESSGSATPRTGWEPAHLTLWRGKTLVAAAPAFRKHHSMGEYVYDFGWAEAAARAGIEYYPKMLAGVPLSPITAPRLLVAPGEDAGALRARLVDELLERTREEGCSSLHVIFPPEDEAALLEKRGFAHRISMQYHWSNPGYATYDDYLARFDSKRRNQLKRERGAAAKQGIVIRTIRGAELDPVKHGELAWKFYEATARRHMWGPIQLKRDFFRLAFERLGPNMELVVAEHDGRVVGGAFNVAWRDRLFGRYWGCFEEFPFLHFHVCLYHSIDECIRLGRKVFEPGAGGEHKIARGFAPTAIHSAHQILDRRLASAIEAAIARERAHLAPILENAEEIAGMRPFLKENDARSKVGGP